ncbi:hypothetical protein MW887_001353 [Aspergillus wentii]|nr:hypothetical protein MW887_001353 [Aspergillus wentii]
MAKMKGWCIFAGAITVLQLGLARATQSQVPLVDTFQTYRHSDFPSYSVRIKEQSDEVCDAGSNQYTGWFDFNGKHMFFCKFCDPGVVDSVNKLKGVSGMVGKYSHDLAKDSIANVAEGMLLELGPCRINPRGEGTHRNPYSWTTNSSMIFIDQPAGTGLSYTDPGTDTPTTSQIAAEDMYIFLQIFLSSVFPERRSVPFHIAGESYGGHYVPTLSAEILRQNQMHPQRPNIDLKSILIGNGFVSPMDTTFGYYETLYYINTPVTWEALEVPGAVANFSIESEEVSGAFESGNDPYSNVMDAVRFTLENGVDVLIYNGNLDLACNTAGNLRWTNSLRWNGQAEFVSQDLKPWTSVIGHRKTQVGSYKEVIAPAVSGSENRRFAFVIVDRSGHMVPLDQPEVALDLYQRWLFQQSF